METGSCMKSISGQSASYLSDGHGVCRHRSCQLPVGGFRRQCRWPQRGSGSELLDPSIAVTVGLLIPQAAQSLNTQS